MDVANLAYTMIFFRCFITTIVLSVSAAGNAEEGGSGHYFPGSMSSFIDGVPGDPARVRAKTSS